MTLTTNILQQLYELMTRLVENSRIFQELAANSEMRIVRELMECKSRRFNCFSYEIKTNLMLWGIFPDVISSNGRRRFEVIRPASNLTPTQTVTIASHFEGVLLSSYCLLLREPLPVELKKILEDQHGLINRCNHSISLLIRDIITCPLPLEE